VALIEKKLLLGPLERHRSCCETVLYIRAYYMGDFSPLGNNVGHAVSHRSNSAFNR